MSNETIVRSLFESVVSNDYESLAVLFADNARDATENYLSLVRRWQLPQKEVRDRAGKSTPDTKFGFR